eukprot:CAMPEP_0119547148 /NCGR_PEP_ID=MMETSP1352-20130426/1356_1 /TAXON_ID=265584 /ORGANISM="Stauroneis constricta, Strain CCMP1120" /LENGTH=435 /DNA_ID=CAMNT_0007592005 /DNA_START=18 /DNA_END=1325 /DNA_ORIENTATION=-
MTPSSNPPPGDSAPPSPSHFGLSGSINHEEMSDFLGGIYPEHHDHHHHHHQMEAATVAALEVEDVVHQQIQPVIAGSEAPGCATHAAPNAAATKGEESELDVPTGVVSEAAAQARSERKRTREKQRRFDVNKQFNDLTQLIKHIEAEEAHGDINRVRLTFSPTNRVDLISRTIAHLSRLHEANKRRKVEVDGLKQELDRAKKAGEDTAQKLKEAMFSQPAGKQVMMMVPMMMPGDQMRSAGHGAATGAAAMPMMNPFMMQQHQQQFMAPAPPPAAAAAPATSPQGSVASAPPPPAGAPAANSAASSQQSGSGASTPQPMMSAMAMPFGGGMMMPMAQQQQFMMSQMMPMSMPAMQQQSTNQAPVAPQPAASMQAMGGYMFAAPQGAVQSTVPQPNGSVLHTTNTGAATAGQQEAKSADEPASNTPGSGANLAHCA